MNALAIAVLGAGNWGTVLAHLAAKNGHDVRLWTRSAEQKGEINARHENARSVPGLAIDARVRATTDLAAAIGDASVVLFVVPAQAFREVARAAGDVIRPEHVVLHATKGIEIGSRRRMSEILLDETCARQIGVVCGPNIAAEIARGKPAGTTVASRFPRVVELGRRALSSTQLMVFAGQDVIGVELCGALKNVVAIAAGMAEAMQVGENAKAFLVTRGMTEIMRLATKMGAEPATMMGLAGIGDLMVTCASPLSRNHRVGTALARGEPLSEITARLGMVAEGVPTSIAARELAHAHRVEMPLFERVHRVLHHGLSPERALEELMRLPSGRDVPQFLTASYWTATPHPDGQ